MAVAVRLTLDALALMGQPGCYWNIEESYDATVAWLLGHGALWSQLLALQYKTFCGGCTVVAVAGSPLMGVLGDHVLAWKALGGDVTAYVCRTYTSLSVGTQFAILNPRTHGAVDVELVLPADSQVGEAFAGGNPKFTRRLRVSWLEGVPGAVAVMGAAAATVRG